MWKDRQTIAIRRRGQVRSATDDSANRMPPRRYLRRIATIAFTTTTYERLPGPKPELFEAG